MQIFAGRKRLSNGENHFNFGVNFNNLQNQPMSWRLVRYIQVYKKDQSDYTEGRNFSVNQ